MNNINCSFFSFQFWREFSETKCLFFFPFSQLLLPLLDRDGSFHITNMWVLLSSLLDKVIYIFFVCGFCYWLVKLFMRDNVFPTLCVWLCMIAYGCIWFVLWLYKWGFLDVLSKVEPQWMKGSGNLWSSILKDCTSPLLLVLMNLEATSLGSNDGDLMLLWSVASLFWCVWFPPIPAWSNNVWALQAESFILLGSRKNFFFIAWSMHLFFYFSICW